MDLYGDSQGITWLEALAKAEKELERERSKGLSSSKYSKILISYTNIII